MSNRIGYPDYLARRIDGLILGLLDKACGIPGQPLSHPAVYVTQDNWDVAAPLIHHLYSLTPGVIRLIVPNGTSDAKYTQIRKRFQVVDKPLIDVQRAQRDCFRHIILAPGSHINLNEHGITYTVGDLATIRVGNDMPTLRVASSLTMETFVGSYSAEYRHNIFPVLFTLPLQTSSVSSTSTTPPISPTSPTPSPPVSPPIYTPPTSPASPPPSYEAAVSMAAQAEPPRLTRMPTLPSVAESPDPTVTPFNWLTRMPPGSMPPADDQPDPSHVLDPTTPTYL